MRLILVPTADRPECAVALDVAFKLAKELGADVSGCHVRPERHERRSPAGALMPEDVYEASEHSAPKRGLDSAAAQALFARVSQRHGFTLAKAPRFGTRSLALWHEMVGTPARVLGIVGPVSDMAVVSRPKRKSAGRARAFLLAALLHSGKPALVVPQRRLASIGKTVVIAWNQSAEAAMAVTAALPLLERAEHVVAVSSGPESRPGPKSAYLAQYLTHWDVKIDRVRTKGRDVEAELEQAYRDAGADLLVMGAYSRPRIRELMFGGVTEHMLFKTEIPVLMLHR